MSHGHPTWLTVAPSRVILFTFVNSHFGGGGAAAGDDGNECKVLGFRDMILGT